VLSCSLTREGVEGFVYRRCLEDGTWEETADISECISTKVKNLQERAVS